MLSDKSRVNMSCLLVPILEYKFENPSIPCLMSTEPGKLRPEVLPSPSSLAPSVVVKMSEHSEPSTITDLNHHMETTIDDHGIFRSENITYAKASELLLQIVARKGAK